MHCIDCGIESPADARFCIECGSDMPPVAPGVLVVPPPAHATAPVGLRVLGALAILWSLARLVGNITVHALVMPGMLDAPDPVRVLFLPVSILLVELVLSVLLLVSGIGMLAGRLWGRTWGLVFAWIAVPVQVLLTVVWFTLVI